MADFRNLIFYIPFLYVVYSRIKTVTGIVRWLLVYLLPIGVIAFCRNGFSIDWLILVLGVISVYNLYEMGYIQNDTETTKREVNPTLRLPLSVLSFYNQHRFSIYIFRFIIAVVLFVLLLRLGVHWYPLAFGFLLIPSYLLYNSVRNKYSYWIYLWLMIVRYICPAWICCESLSVIDMIYIVLMAPVPSFIIRFSVDRFEYHSKFVHKYLIDSIKELNVFRTKYYVVLTVLCAIWYWIDGTVWFYFAISLYFLTTALITKIRDRK